MAICLIQICLADDAARQISSRRLKLRRTAISMAKVCAKGEI